MNESPHRFYVGVDWGSSDHHVCLINSDGKHLGERSFPHSGSGLVAMRTWIQEQTGAGGEEIAVAIEVPHGPVVDSLIDHGCAVHAINPKQLDRFRDRYSPAGAKDDSRDALVLASALRTDPHCLRKINIDDPLVIRLRTATRYLRKLKQERTRIAAQVREQLWRYYPAILSICKTMWEPFFIDLWRRVPTPEKAKRVHLSTLRSILNRHRIRRLSAQQVKQALGVEPVHIVSGVTEAATSAIDVNLIRLEVTQQQIRRVETDIATITDQLIAAEATDEDDDGEEGGGQRDVTILSSIPGVGQIVLATLIAEAPHLIKTRDYQALRCLCGVAPVTKRSGKSLRVSRRLAAHPHLQEAIYHLARVAAQRDPTSKAKYQALRARGHTHGRALRTVGDRLLAVACAMLRDQTLYKPAQKTPIPAAATTSGERDQPGAAVRGQAEKGQLNTADQARRTGPQNRRAA